MRPAFLQAAAAVVIVLLGIGATHGKAAESHPLTLVAEHGAILNATNGNYEHGTVLSLDPAADFGFVFGRWKVNGEDGGTNIPLVVTVNGPTEVTAEFHQAISLVEGTILNWEVWPATAAYAKLYFCNPSGSGASLMAPFHVFVAGPDAHFLSASGTDPVTGLPYLDVTRSVLQKLSEDGDGDSTLDPGECVIVEMVPLQLVSDHAPQVDHIGLDAFEYSCGDRGLGLGFTPLDLTGNGAADLVTYIASFGAWRVLPMHEPGRSAYTFTFGSPNTVPVPADYDGDGADDFAFYWTDLKTFQVHQSGLQPRIVRFSTIGNIPLAGNFTGASPAIPALYSRATGLWTMRGTTPGAPYSFVRWGQFDGVPVVGDYDGDCRDDLAYYVLSTGQWHIRDWTTGALMDNATPALGGSNAEPVPADYDGDGRTDLAVYVAVNGTWKIAGTRTNALPDDFSFTLGGFGKRPVPADYDGDGLVDPAVYHRASGEWEIVSLATGSPVPLAGSPFKLTPMKAPAVHNQARINEVFGFGR